MLPAAPQGQDTFWVILLYLEFWGYSRDMKAQWKAELDKHVKAWGIKGLTDANVLHFSAAII